MKYFSIQGSCLISILIPLNFLIGDYAIWFKQHGNKRTKILLDLVILMIGIGITYCLIREKIDPYVPFVFLGGIILAIIQNEFFIKKVEHRQESYNILEIFFKYLNILMGVFICVLPHFSFFYDLILSESNRYVIVICNLIYLIWGIEKIILNGLDIYFNASENK